MPNSLRHVSIHCGAPTGAGSGATVDLSLPAAMTVGELLPWIVDVLDAGDTTPRRWQLAHLGGDALDESATLVQNDIHDGDLLVLTSFCDRPTHDRAPLGTVPVSSGGDVLPIWLRVAACSVACAMGLAALVWAGLGSAGWDRIGAAATVAVMITVVAVSAPRFGLGSTAIATLDVAAVASAGVLGFLVVPAGPAPANFFLATTAVASLTAVLIRASGPGRQLLLAVVTVAGVSATATGLAVLWPLSTPAVGAVVSALGMGLLPLTPRLSIALAGLTPPVPGHLEDQREVLSDNVFDASGDDTRALLGQQNLVGLVAGSATAAALGTTLLALAGRHRVTVIEVAFTAAVGVALLLRSRSYASGTCRVLTVACGFLSLTASFTFLAAWDPGHGSWTGMLAVAAGIAVIWPVTVQSPVTERLADVVEYAALAAVVPLACWLAGAFDLVRDMGLR